MFFFAAALLVGGIWAWFFLPELSGMSLEAVNAVFELPWWRIGRDGIKVARQQRELEVENSEKQAEAIVTRVEAA